jgi:dinuclear metal center YbgI/SA1388 family protein
MADRDEIIAYANETLDLEAYPDYGPMGMQVIGAPTVTKVAGAVSASLELFERTAEAGAQLIFVHHGLFWDNEPRSIDAQMKQRLKALFDNDITLAAYHLALDAHLELGNNAQLARRLDMDVDGPFAAPPFGGIGVDASFTDPVPIDELIQRLQTLLDREPLVFADGPAQVRRVAIVSGGGGVAAMLPQAAQQGYDLFLTGEPAEPTMMSSKELGIHFVAAGHYATERFGVIALGENVAERFDLDWEFIELTNPV